MAKLLVFLIAASLYAGDLSGIWVGTLLGRNGDLIDVSFQLKQNGTAVEGKLYGDYRSTAISEGKIDGDQVTFIVMAQEQSGNELVLSRLKFTGVLNNGELIFVRERESAIIAGSGTKMAFRNNNPIELRLKKLL